MGEAFLFLGMEGDGEGNGRGEMADGKVSLPAALWAVRGDGGMRLPGGGSAREGGGTTDMLVSERWQPGLFSVHFHRPKLHFPFWCKKYLKAASTFNAQIGASVTLHLNTVIW